MKRSRRIHNEPGLQLGGGGKLPERRLNAELREDRCGAHASKENRNRYFVHTQLGTGRKIRVLTVVDTFTRFSPVLKGAVQASRRGSGADARADVCRGW